MNFKNKGYFKFSHKDAPFLPKTTRRDGINTTKQLPNGVFAHISFTISILCYTAVRDFMNKFTTQMDSEGFKEELTKLS